MRLGAVAALWAPTGPGRKVLLLEKGRGVGGLTPRLGVPSRSLAAPTRLEQSAESAIGFDRRLQLRRFGEARLTAEHLDELCACVLSLHLLRALSAVRAVADPNVSMRAVLAEAEALDFVHTFSPFAANPLPGFSRAAIAFPI
jgi:hypothetical protein